MAINFEALKTSLYNWATSNVPSGMPVVYYFPNAPRPTVDYVTLLISTFEQIDWDYRLEPTDEAGNVQQVGDREFVLHVQAYGGQPMNVLENLRTSLQMVTVLDSLRANGIVFVSWYPIQDITDLVDSRFEQRASMDVRFRLANVYGDVLGTIAQVELEEIILNVDGSTVIDETVLIPPTI